MAPFFGDKLFKISTRYESFLEQSNRLRFLRGGCPNAANA